MENKSESFLERVKNVLGLGKVDISPEGSNRPTTPPQIVSPSLENDGSVKIPDILKVSKEPRVPISPDALWGHTANELDKQKPGT